MPYRTITEINTNIDMILNIILEVLQKFLSVYLYSTTEKLFYNKKTRLLHLV